MENVTKNEILDILCIHYGDLKILCNEYEIKLPNSNDLGYVRNYLNDNLDKILECIDLCYCGQIVEKTKNIIRKDNYYDKNT